MAEHLNLSSASFCNGLLSLFYYFYIYSDIYLRKKKNKKKQKTWRKEKKFHLIPPHAFRWFFS